MTIKEVINILDECRVITRGNDPGMVVKAGCGCDLMSDVLAYIKPGAMLLTGLNNPQAIRTAEIADIKAVCFVRGKKPSPEMIEMAQGRGIVLLTTSLPMFEACGRLFTHGLVGCSSFPD